MKKSIFSKAAVAVALITGISIYSNAQVWSGSSISTTTTSDIQGRNLVLTGNTLKIGGSRSTIVTQGDNNTTHVGGLQMITPDNGTTFIITPTDASNAIKGTSTITLGGFGVFNSSTVNMAVSGTLGVGMTCIPSDARMAVGGKLYATAIQVKLTSGGCFPDYVFEKDYKLMPLSEIEKYIKANKHLPEVPSAKEVEEKGIDVANMDVILLKKIEELTLHMIEMKKENDLLKEGVKALKNK